jgi:hypothetical protein
MKDRISTFPGRVRLVVVDGTTDTFDFTRADSPTQEGTPFNKNTLLNDDAAAKVWPAETKRPEDPTVSEAIQELATNGGFLIGDILYTIQSPDIPRQTNENWLLCKGGPVDQENYPDLYALMSILPNLSDLATDIHPWIKGRN